MPLVACPECGSRTRVGAENLGRSIDCSRCTKRFAATAEQGSWTRVLSRKHPAGYYAGQALLLLTVLIAVVFLVATRNQETDVYGALFRRNSLPWARGLFWTGVGSLLAGAFLIHRFRKARSRWPRH